ncbi:MAG: carbohydrate ABC transporter permease [Alphaproteobacteria bacterium]
MTLHSTGRSPRRQPGPGEGRLAGLLGTGLPVLFMVLYVFYAVGPLVWLILSSMKGRADLFAFPPPLFFTPDWSGYQAVFGVGAGAETASAVGLWQSLVNSVVISVSGTLLAVALGTLAGYAVSRFAFPGKGDFMFFVISTRMLPPVAVLVFYHIMFAELGLSDTREGLILIAVFINLGLATWIMKGFFDGIPQDVERIAMANGYSRLYAFFRFVLPMAKGGVAAVAGFCFIFSWNEYAFTSIISTTEAKTLPAKIASAMGSTGIEWTQICAAGVVLVVPVVVFFYFIRHYLLMGMTFGVLGAGDDDNG